MRRGPDSLRWIIPAGIICAFASVVGTYLSGSGISPSAYNTVLINAAALTNRSKLNLVNSGCVDNAGTFSTDCTLAKLSVVANVGALPAASCNPGDLAIVSAATLGQQIYENSGSGACVWTQQLGGGGSGSVNVGTINQTAFYAAAGSTISGGGPGTATQVWTSNGAGVAPSFQAAGGGTTVTSVPPYITLAGTAYVSWDMHTATKPTAATYLNGVTCTTTTTGVNGDLVVQNTTNINCWGGYTATASVESDFGVIPGNPSPAGVGIWIRDSTNNNIYEAAVTGTAAVILNRWTYTGAGNPAYAGTPFSGDSTPSGNLHLKLSVSAGTLSLMSSANGGQNFITVFTVAGIGTISQAGYALTNVSGLDVFSLILI